IDAAIETAPERIKALVAALQALRGVRSIVAFTAVTEVGSFSRFASPRPLMGYSGLTPSEYSSGARTAKAGITKAATTHLPRNDPAAVRSKTSRAPRKGRREQVTETPPKALHRPPARYWKLPSSGNPPSKAATAVARELLGFMWAIAVHIERQFEALSARESE